MDRQSAKKWPGLQEKRTSFQSGEIPPSGADKKTTTGIFREGKKFQNFGDGAARFQAAEATGRGGGLIKGKAY